MDWHWRKPGSLFVVGILLAATLASCLGGANEKPPTTPQTAETVSATPSSELAVSTSAPVAATATAASPLAVSFSFAPYKPRQVTLPTGYQGYALPVDLAQVTYLEGVKLTPDQEAALKANGFFVTPDPAREFSVLYGALYAQKQPIFITTDSALHVYHLLFDKLLRSAESQRLAPDLLALSRELLAMTQSTYDSAQGTPLEDAATRALAYFAVAVRLQDPQAPIPEPVTGIVERELALIQVHEGWAVSPLFDRPDLPEADKYLEDYSQYVPRGHYTRSETLQRYFQAMMWYGRLNFRLKDREETRTALLIVQMLLRTNVGDQPALKVWGEIYEPTAFFVGRTDDLNVYDYIRLVTQVYGVLDEDPRLFANNGQLTAFIEAGKALPAPRINSLAVQPGEKREEATRGFRFMGQRFVIDAYVFDQLLWDRVGTPEQPRALPRSLDIAAAFGSAEALKILEEMGETAYANYPEQMDKVRQEIAALPPEAWQENLYWGWLYAFQPLLAAKDGRYPEFMRTQAWTRKDLQTMVGSWTELKHDTILYAKQAGGLGAGEPEANPAPGYVEPNPEVYARLAALVEMTAGGLESRGLLSEPDRQSLERLGNLLARLQAIAEKELAGESLPAEDEELIRNYGMELGELVRASADSDEPGTSYLEDQQAAIVADVATAGSQVLEEGTGRIARLYVIIEAGEQLVLAQGGVYSYYEFTWPADDRLTDEKWHKMLDGGQTPPRPAWVGMFTVE